jgi:hypothetical protein
MWRMFRWLDRHPPGFYKFTVMLAGLTSVVAAAFLLGNLHPAAGLIFGYVAIFALLRASHTYRFRKRETDVPQRELPLSQASDEEILRRVRRAGRTGALRRHILDLAAREPGPEGDRARRIVASWEAAGKKEEGP